MEQVNYHNLIVVNPKVRFGKPCIKDTRIAVSDVLGWLASGMSMEEITADYPTVTREGILACLAFAADKERVIKIAV